MSIHANEGGEDPRETRIVPSLIKAQSRCFDPAAIRKLALRHLSKFTSIELANG
jgi:hypothetical protein